jgi:DHA1 family multidrug resistance protein-like MFS transporter
MNRQLFAIMIILITLFTGFGIIIPVMPEMVVDAGAAPFHLGMMLAVYSAASFLMSPLWGALSDRWGRRPIILIGVLGFSMSFFIFGISADNLWLMYASRILGGFFSGAATSCAVAYVADTTTEEQRTKGMGLVGMSIGLGFIFGPALGGLLSVYGNAVPFFAASLLSLAILLFAWVYLTESLPLDKRAALSESRQSRWTAFAGPLKYLYVLGFFVSFTLAGLEATLQYFEIAKFGATPKDIGIMFAVSGIVGALIQGGVVRRYIKKGDEGKAIQIGLIVSAIGFFLLLFSKDLLTATVFLSIFAVGNALIRPCVTSLITQKTTVGQGVATGLGSSMDSLGRIAGPLLGAAAYQLDISLPFVIGGILSLGASLLLYRYIVLDRKRELVKRIA